jgi:hypothetical protein
MSERSIAPIARASATALSQVPTGILQRKCACGKHTIGGQCDSCKEKSQTSEKKMELERSVEGKSIPLQASTFSGGAFRDMSLIPAQGNQLYAAQLIPSLPNSAPEMRRTPIHFYSSVADSDGARAVTADGSIHIGKAASSLPDLPLQSILAHESAHVAQGLRGKEHGHLPDIELEAHRLAPDVLAGRSLQPRFHAPSGARFADTPYDKMVVERAKQRLALLNKFVEMWEAREIRRLHTASERDPRLQKRKEMDKDLIEPPGTRAMMEEQNLGKLNRLPLQIKVEEDAIKFRVNFQLSFEDPATESRFDELKTSVAQGIKIVWNQKLTGTAFGGRQFAIEPQFARAKTGAPRDKNFWLITVRATDTAPVAYPGCSLDQPTAGVPTSVTDSACAGGVMSIPPLHVARPGILGHELLHLFGLVDRYMALYSQAPGKKTTVQTAPVRETEGRPDPLGAEDGTILSEDLAFLFDRLGVYTMEENRGLEALGKLEKQGMTIGQVRGEIHRQEEIIRLGHDPRSLIPIRKDFKDKMLHDADNL